MSEDANSGAGSITRRRFRTSDDAVLARAMGVADENAKLLESTYGVLVSTEGADIVVEGAPDDVDLACLVLEGVIERAGSGTTVSAQDVRSEMSQRQSGPFRPKGLADTVILDNRLGPVSPRTLGQKAYVDAIGSSTITFGIGPAGTGKTYLAMACAIASLRAREVGRIILSRPIIEAGESLGYLPGTLTEKVDPYIRPLYDALFDLTDGSQAEAMLRDGTIEIAPLAFMRGRTLNDSFVILDEAQNATPEQMKMFLTRLGNGSRMAVTGDLTQSDLPRGASGLAQALDVLSGIDGISICRLESRDVVRNPLVSAIISAYEEASRKE